MAVLTEPAPAKINLALHVTGQRDDGYHLLDSLVTFADVGEWLELRPADRLHLEILGPMQAGLSCTGNLVLDAANALRELDGNRLGAAMRLHKTMPVSSGIGGGSADAAAALRGLSRLWDMNIDASELQRLALSLGADVPMCVDPKPQRIGGIGELLADIATPSFPILLVNPGVSVSTPDVFAQLNRRFGLALPEPPGNGGNDVWIEWLNGTTNHLAEPAIELAPQIGEVLSALKRHEECRLVRMSGSGATCFGLFSSARSAHNAAEVIRERHPDWWVAAAKTVSGEDA